MIANRLLELVGGSLGAKRDDNNKSSSGREDANNHFPWSESDRTSATVNANPTIAFSNPTITSSDPLTTNPGPAVSSSSSGLPK
ncbi:hypothetical protein FBU30_006080 [Linnemannia zychae]|nr:hypothetical protein FBU30_006080 [Linnemannia zychae]